MITTINELCRENNMRTAGRYSIRTPKERDIELIN
jgi:hypothetical protein